MQYKKSVYFIITVVFLLSNISFSQITTTYKTKYVFVVAIDGLRYEEGFGAANTYIPFLWDSLRPKGTIFTNFYNTGITTSNSGHSQITNGVRQVLLINTNSRISPNQNADVCPLELQYSNKTGLSNPSPNALSIDTDLRPTEPTIGEYYRKFTSAPANDVYYINGHSQIWRNPVSLFSGYGPEYAPIVIPVRSDYETLDSAYAIIDRDHPTLSYVLFGAVDAAGHSGDTTNYLGQIRQVDSLIYQLWNKIQSDSIYANKTTMLITTDHGRHDELHSGWRNHGDECNGCRHVFLMGLGPDFKTNTVIETVHDHVDIAPTVGKLLGFPTTLSQGNSLDEMFISPNASDNLLEEQSLTAVNFNNLSRSKGFSRSPSITKNSAGLHIVYSDNTNGNSEILYVTSSNFGLTWSVPTVIMSDPVIGNFEMEPSITAVDSNSLYVVSSGYHYLPSKSTYYWLLRGILSENSGQSWNAITVLDTQLVISTKPTVTSSGNYISAFSTVSHSLKTVTSIDGGVTFGPSKNVEKFGYPQYPSATYIKSLSYVVWQNVSWYNTYWNIWFSGEPWLSEFSLSENLTDSYSYYPSIATDNSKRLHTVYSYAYVPDSLAPVQWQTSYLRSLDSGKTWQDFNVLSGNSNSFMSKVKTSDNGKICVIWSSFTRDKWSIWGTYSTDAGITWQNPFQITKPQPFSIYPDFAVSKDTLFIAWQNYDGKNWELYFAKYVLPISASLKELKKDGISDLSYSLDQNYPNPFNPSTMIRFTIPENTFVTLKIYNSLGEEINTLVNEEKDAGIYEIEFNANDLASGVYFYSLTANDFTSTKKFLLMR